MSGTIDSVLNVIIVPVILIFVGWKLKEPIMGFVNWIRSFRKGDGDSGDVSLGGIDYE